jgi:hypothetical protein|nr:MAG TPA: hypothetical protein [Caudoviricetes sp.]
MNKELLDIADDLSNKPTTELALQIMELCGENLILEQQVKKQKEVIDRILNETKETRNILNNNRDDNMLSKSCLLSYLEIVEDLLEEVSE